MERMLVLDSNIISIDSDEWIQMMRCGNYQREIKLLLIQHNRNQEAFVTAVKQVYLQTAKVLHEFKLLD